MYQQQGRLYKWQPEWNSHGRGRGRGRGYEGWCQFGPPPTHLCPCACHKGSTPHLLQRHQDQPMAPMQPMAQPIPPPPPGWIQLDASGNVPSAQPR
ncbi:hypothetical protein ACLKA6_017490 [Drosophila palustris]